MERIALVKTLESWMNVSSGIFSPLSSPNDEGHQEVTRRGTHSDIAGQTGAISIVLQGNQVTDSQLQRNWK